MPRNLDIEILQLMKKNRCFNYKESRHTMLNCLEKTKIFIITNTLNINNIKNIDQRKE